MDGSLKIGPISSCLPLVSWKRQQEMILSKKLKTNSNKKKIQGKKGKEKK